MTKRTYYTCDRCDPSGIVREHSDSAAIDLPFGGAFHLLSEAALIRYRGWVRLRDGSGKTKHLCPKCEKEEPKWRPKA